MEGYFTILRSQESGAPPKDIVFVLFLKHPLLGYVLMLYYVRCLGGVMVIVVGNGHGETSSNPGLS